jgi:hypothetical protein
MFYNKQLSVLLQNGLHRTVKLSFVFLLLGCESKEKKYDRLYEKKVISCLAVDGARRRGASVEAIQAGQRDCDLATAAFDNFMARQ